MLLPPGPPALLLLAGILLAAAAQDPRYQINQPVSLSAPAGGSVTLPCTFIYPEEIKPLQDLRVYWRRGGFYGEFIYNHTEGFTRQDYRDRIVLVGDPRGSRTASICINRLRESDASEYVCHIRVQRNNGTWEQWRRHPGTHLTVTAQALTTNAPCTAQATTPATATTQRPAGTGAAPVIGGVLAGAVLLAGIIGLAVYGARKRTGRRQKDPLARAGRPPAPALPEAPGPWLALRRPGVRRARHCPEAARAPRGPHGRDPLLSRPGPLGPGGAQTPRGGAGGWRGEGQATGGGQSWIEGKCGVVPELELGWTWGTQSQ
ncbi:paired immunoglobulin-like type 2 receptor beta isoform X1 [Malaclemys terrapin pileata]|uniref:paired immunoglobulin-like type 2 receptor beta isoform X1 n=1 Tax=Malaclemys terrapin pileata TaxID=2991368 RepID=UPI0023A8CEC3|nr:paired immunoglobulin-like type 2 receptor beta isoform X1 [Malaclemys terrapin pileata]